MSKKRTSTDSSKDEETNEGLDSEVQQEDNVKRSNLTSFSDTKLEDLPMELISFILVKVVAMEVKDTKLAKSVWKEKVDVVINRSRLRTVCSQWNNILTTNFFRNEVNRTLNNIAQDVLRMEISHQSPAKSVLKAATVKNEVFMMCSTYDWDHHIFRYVINVYNRNDMAEVKDVIQLGGLNPESMLVFSVSSCLCVVNVVHLKERFMYCLSVVRIKRDDQQKFNILPWISDKIIPRTRCSKPVSESFDGGLITIANHSCRYGFDYTMVSIYCADGTLQHDFRVSNVMPDLDYVDSATQRSYGNLVLLCRTHFGGIKLVEMDLTGSIVRQYQSSFRTAYDASAGMIFTDICGRIVLTDMNNRYEFLDSEFNLMEFTGLAFKKDRIIRPSDLNFNSETGEAVTILYEDCYTSSAVLTIFRFTVE